MPLSPDRSALFNARRFALLACAAVTVWRLAELFLNPLNLSFDEAQYWAWAQTPDWGYFSKPPMVAWIIWLTTHLGRSDAEPWVRLGATLAHVITAMTLFFVAQRLARRDQAPAVGLWSAIVWITLPGVAVSAMIISTDAFLLMFWALALAAYSQAVSTNRLHWWCLLGVWLGLGLLSKYAMAFFLMGMLVHMVWSRSFLLQPRKRPGLLIALIMGGLFYLPNWLWNRSHGFVSYYHTRENANLNHGYGFNLGALAEFIGSQFAVFGPFLFTALLVLLVLLLWRGRALPSPTQSKDQAGTNKLLISFVLPPLILMCIQAYLSRANANWAATAFVAATPLVVGWLLQTGRRIVLGASVALHLVAAFVMYDLQDSVSQFVPAEPAKYDALKRVRGWKDGGAWVRDIKRQNQSLPLLYLDRKVMASMLYYARPLGWDSVIFNPQGHVMNHYELTTTMAGRKGQTFLLITRGPPAPNVVAYFQDMRLLSVFRKPIYVGYTFTLYAYRAVGYRGNDHHD